MAQRRRYKNPPIEEALCEFRFKSGQSWNLTIPGKLQVKLGDEYSGKPREQKAIQVGLDVKEGKPANLRYDEGLAKVQLATEDGKRIVGVGEDALSIHMLRPYQTSLPPEQSGWDEFKPRISSALNAYWEVAQPHGVCRVGVRYINKIVVPQSKVRVEEYLRCASLEVEGLPEDYSNFVSRIEYLYPDSVRLVLSHGLVIAPSKQAEILIDLDVIWENPTPVTQKEALKKADELRIKERAAFEAVVTDKARELFNAD